MSYLIGLKIQMIFGSYLKRQMSKKNKVPHLFTKNILYKDVVYDKYIYTINELYAINVREIG